jgi:hypothetical protein
VEFPLERDLEGGLEIAAKALDSFIALLPVEIMDVQD